MHSLKPSTISFTLVLFRGVNEKWKLKGFWFREKWNFLSFMNFWIALNEYVGWSNPIQQIRGYPYTLKPSLRSYVASNIVAILLQTITILDLFSTLAISLLTHFHHTDPTGCNRSSWSAASETWSSVKSTWPVNCCKKVTVSVFLIWK